MSFTSKKLANSPVEKVCFRGHKIYIKRDDLLSVQAEGQIGENASVDKVFNGNKARKLYDYLCNDVPNVSRIISYGSAQSNMLFSLSVLARLKGWQLDFYVDHIAGSLRGNPRGNYAEALANGAKIHSVGLLAKEQGALNTEDYVQSYVLPNTKDALYIPEGGRNEKSEFGIKLLADELINWVENENITNPKLMLPSGTGTTAFYLQKHLPFEVLTCACVGSAEYLQQQFAGLEEDSENYPSILPATLSFDGSHKFGVEVNNKKHHFGKLYPEFLQIWQELQEQTGITFELLYDPLGWLSLLSYLQTEAGRLSDVIYLHQGGLLGNETMLSRYKRKRFNARCK